MTWTLTPELEDEIAEALENGVGLRAWCSVKGRPSRSTVLKWQREIPTFNAKCAHAREAAGELSAEEQYEIVQKCIKGEIPADIAGRALSGLQWRASKLASKVYGDSKTVDLKNTDGSLKQTIDPKKLSDEALQSILAARVSDAE